MDPFPKSTADSQDANRKAFLSSVKNRNLRLSGYPTEMTVELTTRCQLRCQFCPRETPSGIAAKKGVMEPTLFESIAKEYFPYLDYLSLAGGMGEPLLYPHILEAVSLSRRINPECQISISTNALVPRSVEIIENLISDLSFIQISMNAAGDNFEEITGIRGGFAEFTDNVSQIVSMAREWGREIRFNCVVHHRNLNYIPDIIRNASKLQGDKIILTTLNIVSTSIDESYYEMYFSNEYLEIIEQAIEIGQNLGVTIEVFKMQRLKSFANCPFPWNNFYITWEGNVVPCCAKPFADILNYGNVKCNSISNLINCDNAKDFRLNSNIGITPAFCEKCHVLYNPGTTRFGFKQHS